MKNTQVLFKSVPVGWVKQEDFDVVEADFDLEAVGNGENDIVVENLYISLDPYMRGRMNVNTKSYAASWQIGQPCQAGGVSRVIKSRNPGFPVGSLVAAQVNWEEYTVIPNAAPNPARLRKIDENAGIPLSWYQGVAGMPGLTAYTGFFKFGKPKAGETIFISAAAGAVGQVVGQLAKMKGLRVVGCASEDDKISYLLDTLKFDAAFNYKKPPGGSLKAALEQTCPKGIDIYFEHVGGKMLDTVLELMNGAVYYNLTAPEPLYNARLILTKRLLVQGFIVYDSYAEMGEPFEREMGQWLKEGKVVYKEDIRKGLKQAPEQFIDMLKGGNKGKVGSSVGIVAQRAREVN
ncbi:hypothetical protein HDU93_004856 [Gonapodya sp. JEL0774]|nr:hypothetical protein HDU93_004856 [Gonapodya sp. JEL0774]